MFKQLRGLGSSSRTSSLTEANKFGRSNFNTANTENENQQLEGLKNPFANENQDSIYGRPGDDHRQHNNNFAGFGGNTMRLEHQQQQNFGNADDAAGKMHQNYSRSMRGSTDDRLTLDFLGIGGGRAGNSSGGFSQREQQVAGNNEMASLDHSKMSSLSQVRHAFGNPRMQ